MHPRLQTLMSSGEGRVGDRLDEITEQVWRELNGRAPRARIRQVADEVALTFRNATITVFVPIFIRRVTSERLNEEIRREGVRI